MSGGIAVILVCFVAWVFVSFLLGIFFGPMLKKIGEFYDNIKPPGL